MEGCGKGERMKRTRVQPLAGKLKRTQKNEYERTFFFFFCHHRDSVDGSLDHSPTPKSPQIRCPGWEDIADCWLHADEKV